ncbi:alpha/beta hydrolase [Sporosarcina highlanderae]|uniref:Alpha/beta hydrolase n=1 Tax=Sporosarcina highlanderae TaxID=3035916 RepID=A0ABT8JRC2_9BACL|nr:alpha/beta hydrolase [Sporosarcina highlanderae]MDN4607348.1 alpha/beta hydrolase [Sporosarcina highlanderae]
MKRRFLYITGIIGSIYTAILTVLGFYATNRLMYMKLKDNDVIVKREIIAKRFDEQWYETVQKENFWVDSPNGYQLRAVFLRPLDTTRTVIICHGVTENKINSVKYARLFERLGFNSVVYDHRRHGDSGGKTTSFGFYEKTDLDAVVTAVRRRIGSRALLGIHGESMGAATTILYGGAFEGETDFYIVDCPFSDFSEQVLHILRTSTPLRTSMTLRAANLILKFRDGYTTNLISPREAITTISIPMLFIHSMEDDFILPEMTKELFGLKKDKKMMKLFDRGAHAKSFNENPEEYENVVLQFLHEFGFTT